MTVDKTSIAYFAELQGNSLDQSKRHRNEVKLVAGLETNARRTWYIEGSGGVRERRGDEAADKLRTDVWALMRNHNQDGLFA
ncbi:MAG: hypothetical protein A3E01_08400 [Gammaproteobacteria bacterium RIFCSPHIGHO2_12_FULL_63_22]|nr:MAG: hypothetical protein A3E01_08400 [Gammaproteobacteria bacterium RIFCSPHIGHO2_12_FULL_63_22]